jgi:hypothetical protein
MLAECHVDLHECCLAHRLREPIAKKPVRVTLLLWIDVNVVLMLLVQIRLAARVGALAFHDDLTSPERTIFCCASSSTAWTFDSADTEMRLTASFGVSTFADIDVSVRGVLWFGVAGLLHRATLLWLKEYAALAPKQP